MPPAGWLTEAAEDHARIQEVKKTLTDSPNANTNVRASTREYAHDVHVSGPLSEVVEWARAWRGEIEELA